MHTPAANNIRTIRRFFFKTPRQRGGMAECIQDRRNKGVAWPSAYKTDETKGCRWRGREHTRQTRQRGWHGRVHTRQTTALQKVISTFSTVYTFTSSWSAPTSELYEDFSLRRRDKGVAWPRAYKTDETKRVAWPSAYKADETGPVCCVCVKVNYTATAKSRCPRRTFVHIH